MSVIELILTFIGVLFIAACVGSLIYDVAIMIAKYLSRDETKE